MSNKSLAINKCAWLYQSSSKICNKNSVDKYCSYHKYLLKSSTGPQLCIGGCGKGIRGKYKICPGCGGNKYRSLREYNKRKNRQIPTPEEFINSRSASTSNVNISNASTSNVNNSDVITHL